MYNNIMAIERAILSTYIQVDFFCDILNPPTMPKLNENLFSTQFHRRIVQKLNKAIAEKESLSAAGYEIQDKTAGTIYEEDFLYILASNVVPISTIDSYIKILTKAKIRSKHGR